MSVEQNTPPTFNYEAFEVPENIALTFHLGHHFDALDLPDSATLDATLRKADMVILESVHDNSSKNIMAAIAMGRTKEYQNFRSEFKENEMGEWLAAFASSLFASRTATANVDVHVDHPSIKAFLKTEPIVRRAAEWPVREKFNDIVPLLEAHFGATKARDQAILSNIKPEIEAALSTNRRLTDKRGSEPLGVHVYYGATHTSLFDALSFKQQTRPVEGFSVTKSDDSIENELSQRNYANFVRNQDILVDEVEKHFAYLIFASHIYRTGRLKGKVSTRELQDIFFSVESNLDLGNPRTIPFQVDALPI